MSKPSAKFTCKYEIQIPNDKEFQVARRIIGPRGTNMKKIVDICTRDSPYPFNAQDVIKLRLRGQGSGYKEGPSNQGKFYKTLQYSESDEPLHLCISSKYYEKYVLACGECEFLIHQVYQDYRNFCRQRGFQIPNLLIKKQENPTQNCQPNLIDNQNYYDEYEQGADQMEEFDKEQIQAWIQIRNNARKRCDFNEADRIRDMLHWNGITLQDENTSTRWKFNYIS